MDLRLHARILWRYRFLIAAGLVLAVLLTLLSLFRVSTAHGFSLSYRQSPTWQSSETLLLYPANCDPTNLTCSAKSTISSTFYAQIANSEIIRSRVRAKGLLDDNTDYSVTAVTDPNNLNSVTPFLEIDGLGTTAEAATMVARTAASAFSAYLSGTQVGTPLSQAVAIQVVSPAVEREAKVVKGRKLTLPILVFLVVMIATIGLAYVLNNLFPPDESEIRGATRRTVPPRGREARLEQLPASESRQARAVAAGGTTPKTPARS